MLWSPEKTWCLGSFPVFEAKVPPPRASPPHHLLHPREPLPHNLCPSPVPSSLQAILVALPLPSAVIFSQALSLCPVCFFSSLSAPPGHPSPGWCLGLSITSRAGEIFHTLLKHPQNSSPGRRETLFQNRLLLLSEVGNRPAAMSQSTSACNICLLPPTGHRLSSSTWLCRARHGHEEALLRNETREQGCVSGVVRPTRLGDTTELLQAGRPRLSWIPTLSPVLHSSFQVLNKRCFPPWTLSSSLLHAMSSLHRERGRARGQNYAQLQLFWTWREPPLSASTSRLTLNLLSQLTLEPPAQPWLNTEAL